MDTTIGVGGGARLLISGFGRLGRIQVSSMVCAFSAVFEPGLNSSVNCANITKVKPIANNIAKLRCDLLETRKSLLARAAFILFNEFRHECNEFRDDSRKNG